jgi:hypothetical protein
MDISTLRSRHPDHWMRACAIRTLTLDAVAAANSGHSCRVAFKGEMTSSTISMGVLCH